MQSLLGGRRTLMSLAAGIYAAVFALFVVFGRPGLGVGHGFYLAIILVAFVGGTWGGIGAGLVATGLYALAAALAPNMPRDQVTTVATPIRAVTFVAVGIVVGWYASHYRAVHERLTALTLHLEALANRDVLTGLPNTRGFERAIDGRLEAAQPFALLVGDLDDLGAVNGADGREAGDDLLRAVAERLAFALPAECEVGRVGDDEFALVVACERTEDAAQLAAELEHVLDASGSRVTFGWATYPHEATSGLSLFRAADERLYARKLLRGYWRSASSPALSASA
jgi:diguanylate cyclase (GGDEF)-like protein